MLHDTLPVLDNLDPNKPLLVVLTGAGISAESGLKTFREMGGLWESYDVMQVASIEGWYKDPGLVLDFYNQRRQQAALAQPNAGHLALAQLEQAYNVVIITQNVDNLHERAGSTRTIHLHGQLSKVRSTANPSIVFDIGADAIHLGDLCPVGSQLRPHIVWFGEEVPLYPLAAQLAAQAQLFLVVGTALAVYPAAGLVDEVPTAVPKIIIDPNIPPVSGIRNLEKIAETATKGLPLLTQRLMHPDFVTGLRAN